MNMPMIILNQGSVEYRDSNKSKNISQKNNNSNVPDEVKSSIIVDCEQGMNWKVMSYKYNLTVATIKAIFRARLLTYKSIPGNEYFEMYNYLSSHWNKQHVLTYVEFINDVVFYSYRPSLPKMSNTSDELMEFVGCNWFYVDLIRRETKLQDVKNAYKNDQLDMICPHWDTYSKNLFNENVEKIVIKNFITHGVTFKVAPIELSFVKNDDYDKFAKSGYCSQTMLLEAFVADQQLTKVKKATRLSVYAIDRIIESIIDAIVIGFAKGL